MIELGDEFVGIAPVAKDRIRHSTPAKPNQNKRVLCPDQYCSRYIVGTLRQRRSEHRHESSRVPLRQGQGRQARSRGYDQSLIAEAFCTERILTKLLPTINPTLQKPSEAFKP